MLLLLRLVLISRLQQLLVKVLLGVLLLLLIPGRQLTLRSGEK